MSAPLFRRCVPLAMLVAIFLGSSGCGYGAKVQQGSIEVFYKEGATKAEADRLGTTLTKHWGAGGPRRSVQLTKTTDGYRVRMVVKKEFQNDEKMLNGLAFDGARMSRDAFDGAAVEMHACDEHFTTLKVIPPRPDVRFGVVDGPVEVFFAKEADKEDARRLAKFAAKGTKDAPGPISFKLARRNGIVEVHVVMQAASLQNPAIVATWRQNRNEIAANVFKDTTVELHLCDELLNSIQVLN
jgi:hypothetical protein